MTYLHDWKEEVYSSSGLTPVGKSKLILSRQDWKLLVSWIHFYLFVVDVYLFHSSQVVRRNYKVSASRPFPEIVLLSEQLSQDPLENYFGQQRARGGRNENPSLHQCVHNAAAVHVQKYMALEAVRGNCSRKRRLFSKKEQSIDNTPLPKRRRTNKKGND